MPDKGDKLKVLITGAAGRIGSSMAERLKDRYDLRLLYHHTIPENPPVADIRIADLAKYDEVARAMEGVDAVVHLAADAGHPGTWESVRERNIDGTYNVFESARQAGVKKVVFASTNHVMGMYDRDRQWPIYASQPARPDSLYGVSKAFGEILARHYYDQHGLSIICLRIGWAIERPRDEIGLYMWLSHRDCAQLISRAIESPLGYGVFYAISANSRRHWDITETMEKLGYRPQDDAETFAEEILNG
jgi:NAD+ dependent glucose-6-phosphate dehydrogenase